MESRKLISLEIDNDGLDALEDILTAELDAKEMENAKAIVMKLWQSLVVAFDNDSAGNDVANLKAHITWLERKVANLMVQKVLDGELLRLRGQNMEAVTADLLIDPPPVEIHCTENGKGKNYPLRVRNILAIESRGRVKRIYLLKPAQPIEGGPWRTAIETNESLDDLLQKLQNRNLFLMQISRKYAINIFEYTFSEPGIFNIIRESHYKLPATLKSPPIEKVFDFKSYHERQFEISYYHETRKQYGLKDEKIAEITRYKNSLDDTK